MKKLGYVIFTIIVLFSLCDNLLADKLIFNLQNSRVIYSNGSVMSCSQKYISCRGEMIIDGWQITQEFVINGSGYSTTGTIKDIDSTGETLTISYENEFTNKLVLVNLTPNVITLTDTSTYKPYNPISSSFCEVDTWTYSHTEPSDLSVSSLAEKPNIDNDVMIGNVLGSILNK